MPPPTPPIGQLDQIVTIYDPGAGIPDPHGQLDYTPTEVATVFAEIRSPTGSEALVGQQLQAEVTRVVTIRYRDDVTARSHLDWDGRRLELASPPLMVGRRVWLQLQCRETPGDDA